MKKIITLLLTSLMIFTLVGCNPKPIEEQPVEVEPAQVIEPTESETILGGWTDVEDGTLTDELKDIFSKALEGLLGATYEPVKLLAKQVVNGTNYKFLANGTKTTNPITVGTYNITINESSDGTISLVDIETIEESSATPLVDNTQMSYWVVFYDQYGNELQRTIEKYGTVPSFKGTLPKGFDKWVNKNTQKDVDTFKAITTNTYFEAVCHKVEDDDEHTSSSGCSNKAALVYYRRYAGLNDYSFFDSSKIEDEKDGSYLVEVFKLNENNKYECEFVTSTLATIVGYGHVGEFYHDNSNELIKCNNPESHIFETDPVWITLQPDNLAVSDRINVFVSPFCASNKLIDFKLNEKYNGKVRTMITTIDNPDMSTEGYTIIFSRFEDLVSGDTIATISSKADENVSREIKYIKQLDR